MVDEQATHGFGREVKEECYVVRSRVLAAVKESDTVVHVAERQPLHLCQLLHTRIRNLNVYIEFCMTVK